MKKLLITLIVSMLFLAGICQDTKPTATTFKQVQSPQFWFNSADTSVWMYKGNTYGWTQLQRTSKKYSIWNHTGITNTGWADGKLLGFNSLGQVVPLSASAGGGTNLTYTASATDGKVNSDTGTDATIPAGSTTNASLMLPGDKTKLDGVATQADKYSRWYLRTSHGYTGIFSSDYLDFVAGSGITISDNLIAGNRTITFNSTGSMTYPGAGIPLSTGSSWGTSITNNSSNWNAAYVHKTTEDALNGLVKVNGAGVYTAVTDNSTNWNTAYTNMGKSLINGDASYYNLSDTYFMNEYSLIRPKFGTATYANLLPVTGGEVYSKLILKQDAITLTTTGTSGAATFDGITLNIPQYTSSTNYWSTDTYGIYRSSPVAVNGNNTVGYDFTTHGRANFLYTSGATAYAISSESNGSLANFYAANTGANGAGFYANATGTGSFGGIFKGQRSDLKVGMDDTAPSSATDTGQAGEIRVTATYIYVCTATNTWVRAALSSW